MGIEMKNLNKNSTIVTAIVSLLLIPVFVFAQDPVTFNIRDLDPKLHELSDDELIDYYLDPDLYTILAGYGLSLIHI